MINAALLKGNESTWAADGVISWVSLKGAQPIWQDTQAGIESLLTQALRSYQSVKSEAARQLVVRAQFEGY